MTLELGVGDYRLVLTPERGGSVERFDWRDMPIFRPTNGPGPFDLACFPLVPFSNRIAHGRFEVDGREVRLASNFPDQPDNPHTLHGFSWLQPWSVVEASPATAILEHRYGPGEWPWPYLARQDFTLSALGLNWRLSVTNLGSSPMPTGLGLHPYFPRNDLTTYLGLHCGEWRNTEAGLPLHLDTRQAPTDWWRGGTVSTHAVDTVFTDRQGDLIITWPDQNMQAVMRPSKRLAHTVVFSPTDADFFCVEPVSHMTNAINLDGYAADLVWLEPGKAVTASVDIFARPV